MMVLRSSYLPLLALLAVLPAVLEGVSAAPLTSDGASNATDTPPAAEDYASPSAVLSFPLEERGAPSESTDASPWMHLQRRMNSGRRRYALINQLPVPTDEDLHGAMQKRALWVEEEWEPMEQREALDAQGDDESASSKLPGMIRRTNKDGTQLVARGGGYSSTAAKAAQQHSVTGAPSVSSEGTLGLAIEANDIGYFAKVQIGSQNQAFNMLVDSGSADTWVTGSSCSNCGGGNRNKLGSSNSKSLQMQNQNYKVSYGTGSVSVTKASDTMTIAGMKLNNYNIAIATKETSEFGGGDIPFDGLLGLGGAGLSTTGAQSPIDALYKSHAVKAPVVGYRLGRVADGSNRGQVTFGGVDNSQIAGGLQQFDNQSDNGYWQIQMDSVSVGSHSISGASGSATLDTGTTLIVAPASQADAIHNAIKGAKSDGQGGYTVPCSTNQQISFTFSGHTFTMDPRDLLFAPSSPGNLNGMCVSSISAGDNGGEGGWLLGAAFLKNVYFATNTKTNQVGLGKLN